MLMCSDLYVMLYFKTYSCLEHSLSLIFSIWPSFSLVDVDCLSFYLSTSCWGTYSSSNTSCHWSGAGTSSQRCSNSFQLLVLNVFQTKDLTWGSLRRPYAGNITWFLKTEINHLGGWSKFQVSLIYIVKSSQPGLHSKVLCLKTKQNRRTKGHQNNNSVSQSSIPFANSLQILHDHVALKFEPWFHKQDHLSSWFYHNGLDFERHLVGFRGDCCSFPFWDPEGHWVRNTIKNKDFH